MKATMKKAWIVVMALLTMCLLSACTAVQVSSSLVLNGDGSGERQIIGSIAKNDAMGDGYGSAYYYFKQHGDDLQSYLADAYAELVPGSEEWLQVSVDDSGSDWEIVTLSFAFSSFEDYLSKLGALVYDEAQAANYVAPEMTVAEDGSVVYTESTAVMTAVFKSLQTTIMADDTIFDVNSTKDGEALNDGSATDSLEEYGVELMKPENGNVMTISLNGGDATAVEAVDGVFSASNAGNEAVDKETELVLSYSFDDTLANQGVMSDSDLIYGIGSTGDAPVYVDGIDGKAILFDGASYLTSPNKSYVFKEMTVSFYYRMDQYTETDTGANMVLVPAGLGALGAGVIDLEFIPVDDAGIQFLAKMNSADWMTQDKLYSEEYRIDDHIGEWHNYTIVFKNEYDAEGYIEDAFVYMYIDGKLVTRSRLAVAAGLSYGLGLYDDGSYGDPNGGINVGGYYEAETVKRALTGALDNLKVFDGALSEEEIATLCYTVKVDKEYDPDAEDSQEPAEENTDTQEPSSTKDDTDDNTSTSNEEPADGGNLVGIIVAIILVVIICACVAVVVIKKKGTK